MRHAIVYLPGLGDHKTGAAQARILRLWQMLGVRVFYHPMYWTDKKKFAEKLASILEDIDKLAASGYTVSLVGTSAGASAAVNAYAARRESISRVVCICGKLRNPQTVKNTTYLANPAFKDSLRTLPTSLAQLSTADIKQILSLRPLYDNIVPPDDTIIEGSRSQLLPTAGHGFSIAYALIFGSWRITRFIKS